MDKIQQVVGLDNKTAARSTSGLLFYSLLFFINLVWLSCLVFLSIGLLEVVKNVLMPWFSGSLSKNDLSAVLPFSLGFISFAVAIFVFIIYTNIKLFRLKRVGQRDDIMNIFQGRIVIGIILALLLFIISALAGWGSH